MYRLTLLSILLFFFSPIDFYAQGVCGDSYKIPLPQPTMSEGPYVNDKCSILSEFSELLIIYNFEQDTVVFDYEGFGIYFGTPVFVDDYAYYTVYQNGVRRMNLNTFAKEYITGFSPSKLSVAPNHGLTYTENNLTYAYNNSDGSYLISGTCSDSEAKEITDNRVYYICSDNNNTQLFVYDIANSFSTLLTQNSGTNFFDMPRNFISTENFTYFIQKVNGYDALMRHNFSSGILDTLFANPNYDIRLDDIEDDTALLRINKSLYLFNLNTGMFSLIPQSSPARYSQLTSTAVFWRDETGNHQIKKYNLTNSSIEILAAGTDQFIHFGVSEKYLVYSQNSYLAADYYTINNQSINIQIKEVTQITDSTPSGSIDISVQNNLGSLSYSWTGDNGFTATTQDLTNLSPGVYSLTVTDETNCTAQTEVEIFDNSSSLPVELLSFTATQLSKSIELTWQTAFELNNGGFNIQRSTDAQSFRNIGFIEGKGDNNSLLNYRYTDEEVYLPGTYYYRLEQIDTDGKKDYSQIVAINFLPASHNFSEAFQITPNPNAGNFYINFPNSGNRIIELRNFSGQIINTYRSSDTSERIEEHLSSGIYYVSIKTSENTTTKKMVIY